MAAITSTIKIIENLTGTFTKITDKIGQTVNAFENMGRASKYAALSVTRKGTQDSYLTAKEFEKCLANFNADEVF